MLNSTTKLPKNPDLFDILNANTALIEVDATLWWTVIAVAFFLLKRHSPDNRFVKWVPRFWHSFHKIIMTGKPILLFVLSTVIFVMAVLITSLLNPLVYLMIAMIIWRGIQWGLGKSKGFDRPIGNGDITVTDQEALTPQITFASLYGNSELKARLKEAGHLWRAEGKNGILLYGEPGTGKTVFAEALAGELNLPIMKVNIGSIQSRWIGQTTEQLLMTINAAKRQAPCVLFIDEIEAVLQSRGDMGGGGTPGHGLSHSSNPDKADKITAAFLANTDGLRRTGVLLIGATNFRDQIDRAAAREGRFDFTIEVPLPDFEARRGLIVTSLQKMSAGSNPVQAKKSMFGLKPPVQPSTINYTVKADVLDRVATRWIGFNVPRIKEASERACKVAKESGHSRVELNDFHKGLRLVQGNKAGAPEGTKSFADLYLDDDLGLTLKRMATQFKNLDEIESQGGSFPKGIIFYGPPGTGKTTMAKVLAKESGWTFIPTTGRHLLEVNAIKNLTRLASDMRPSIVFIDEADDILGHRVSSGIAGITSELLSAMEGAHGTLPDVVWIAATNNLAGFDQAALRRIERKVEMNIPSSAPMRRMIRDWVEEKLEKGTALFSDETGKWVDDVTVVLEGLAPSNVMAILNATLNSVITDSVDAQKEGKTGKEIEKLVTVKAIAFSRKEMQV